MALPKIDLFGPPDYGSLKGNEGIVFHTPENAGITVSDAMATAKWQATSSNSSGGSYHGILGWDSNRGPASDPDAWVLVKTVPFGHIAGSISTNRDPSIWQPGRYPWIEQLLSPAAYADPNAYLHALCLSGRAAWWSDKLSTAAGRDEVRGAIIRLAQWVKRLESIYDYDALLTLHRHWQTNRTDPDGLNFKDLVLDEYDKLFASTASTTQEPAPAPETTWADKMKQQVADLEAANAKLRADLDGKKDVISTLRNRLQSIDPLADQIAALVQKIKEA